MELTGVIKSIVYRNQENGWTVLELQTDEHEKCMVVGTLPLLGAGERVKLSGSYTTHPKYGRQFKAQSYETLAPKTLSAIEAYLGSGLIRGIGASTARSIVTTFGLDTLYIMDNEPERLMDIPGIGRKRYEMMLASYRENRVMRDILLALEPYGVSVNQAFKLYKAYGELCLARIEENPYRMITDIEGIGFATADRIAQNTPGFCTDSRARIRAGLQYSLTVAKQEYGHTYVPREGLLSYAMRLLEVEEQPLVDTLDELIEFGEVIQQTLSGEDCLFLPQMHRMESEIAERLLRLSEQPIDNPFLRFTAERALDPIQLSEQQEFAVSAALREGLLVITGGPGTGKTTIIRYITEIMTAMNLEVALTAPTGRAAKRMTEATGHDALTIHRLLEYVPGEGFKRNQDDPLFFDMIIVDEMSMVDVPLMHALLRAIPSGTRLILVGDRDQLPPVGPGDVLRDIINSETVRVVRLTEIFRQAQKSLIVTNAHRINAGQMPVLDQPGSDFRYEPIASQDEVLDRVLDLCVKPSGTLFTREPLLDVQVLAPMKKGQLGVHQLNKSLQDALNPHEKHKPEQTFGDTVFREGDRIMQVKNDYKIAWTKRTRDGVSEGTGAFNGDLGTIYRIDTENKRITVLFDDDRLAAYEFTQSDELDLAYCISIHKSQGSEFPIVILPLCGGASLLMTRNLLYTAVTRAKRQVVLLGRTDTVYQMVQNNRTNRRYTALCRRLIEWKELLS